MTLVKARPMVKRYHTINNDFDRLINSFFTNDVSKPQTRGQAQVPVNVLETAGNFCLELAAPGLRKEDFEIRIEKDMLTISANKAEAKDEKDSYKRREFGAYNFKRSFRLADFIDTNAIEATYEQGILKISLMRKAETAPKQITIS
jgi:HSP20 family protein